MGDTFIKHISGYGDIELNSNYVNAKIKANILPDDKMREIGFTDYGKKSWYFSRIRGDLDISFNVTIPKDGSDIRIDVLDEQILNTYDYQYILNASPNLKVPKMVYEFVEKWMAYLQDNEVISGHERGDYI